jgi:hypothetical protein
VNKEINMFFKNYVGDRTFKAFVNLMMIAILLLVHAQTPARIWAKDAMERA